MIKPTIHLAGLAAVVAVGLATPVVALGDSTLPTPPSTTSTAQLSLAAPGAAGAARPGRVLSITARATDAQGNAIDDAEVGCSARVGVKAATVVATSMTNGAATCLVRIPRGTTGKHLTGVVSISRPDGSASRTFSIRIGG